MPRAEAGEAVDTPDASEDRRRLTTGVVLNFLGASGRIIDALFFLVAARLFGPEAVGLFLFSFAVVEGVSKLVLSGFVSGSMMMVARRHGSDKMDEIYDLVAQAIRWTVVASVLLGGVLFFVAPWAAEAIWHREDAGPVMQALTILIPLLALVQIPVAATKGLVIMKHEVVIHNFVVPFSLLGTAVVLGLLDTGPLGLVAAMAIAQTIGAVFSLRAFAREFQIRKLFGRLFRTCRVKGLLSFALPQGLNEFLNYCVMQLDIIMLAAFLEPDKLAMYGIVSRIALALRKVRMGFASAYSPLIARYFEQGKKKALIKSFSMVTRWILTLAMPVVLVVVAIRLPLLRLVHPSFTFQTEVLPLLLIGPLVNGFLGLHGNAILMTGHSKLNLLNSVIASTLNVILNLLLIPKWGMIGAATATATSMSTVAILETLEARLLFGIGFDFKLVYKPLLAGAAAACIVAGMWVLQGLEDWLAALPTALAVLGVYAGVLWLIGFDPEDRKALKLGKGKAKS